MVSNRELIFLGGAFIVAWFILNKAGIKHITNKTIKENWDILAGPVYDYCKDSGVDFNKFVDAVYQ